MRKKILISLLVVVIISIIMFWNRYKSDIYLFYNQLQFEPGFSVDKMVLSKASEFIPRISFYYNNNYSIKNLDNYFDKKCKIVFDNNNYIYSEDIKNTIIKKNKKNDNIIILPSSSKATIINHKKNEFNILVSGKLTLSSNNDEALENSKDEIYYEYTVTFEKKFFFIWKATYFKTESELIANLMIEK